MKHYRQVEIDTSTTVKAALAKYLTRRQVSRLKTRTGILKNGRPVHTNEPLAPGDILSWYLYETADRDIPFDILYEDEHILAISKPAGLVCHPSPGHETDSIQSILGQDLYLAGRLDKDTSGILVYAKYPALVHQLNLEKTYLAVVAAFEPDVPCTIGIPLSVTDTRIKKSVPDPAGKPAITHILKKEPCETGMLLTIRIEHGRMHQIRAHLASTGHPLVNDSLYGTATGKRTLLHCAKCAFIHPVTHEPVTIEDCFPQDFPVKIKE